MTAPLSSVYATSTRHENAERWSAAQAAAVAAAEAIAATAAAEVAAEAAITAQAAVDVALEAARKAAAKATEVAALAVVAAAAAAVDTPNHLWTSAEQLTYVDRPAAAAAKVALCVRDVAAAASTAALEAAAVVAEQAATDIAAAAAAVTIATSQPALVGEVSIGWRANMDDPEGRRAAGAEMRFAFEAARAVDYAAGTPQMLALNHAEDRWTLHKRV